MRRIGLQNYPYCGRADMYASQPKTWHDEVCCFFFFQVVRCHTRMRRHYRPLFLPPVPTTPVKRLVQIASQDERERRSA
jgi:hypothetical protein